MVKYAVIHTYMMMIYELLYEYTKFTSDSVDTKKDMEGWTKIKQHYYYTRSRKAKILYNI